MDKTKNNLRFYTNFNRRLWEVKSKLFNERHKTFSKNAKPINELKNQRLKANVYEKDDNDISGIGKLKDVERKYMKSAKTKKGISIGG